MKLVGATRRHTILRISVVSVLVALALPPAGARSDIGIRKLSTSVARPGDYVTVFASGYIGPKPWRPMPVVMIQAALAPKPIPVRGGFASPQALRSQLSPPRYRIVGAIRDWRPRDGTRVNAAGRLRFRVPRVASGLYVFALFCETCTRGPEGSLIIDARLRLRVRR